MNDFVFNLFSFAATTDGTTLEVFGVEWGERHGALFSISTEVCQCGDAECSGRTIHVDLFWWAFFSIK